MKPLISVVIPAYNVETFIESTLQSILAQDYPNIEIIMVDDASTDRTSEIAKNVLAMGGRPWHVVDHEINKGQSGARNTGMQVADGQYIIFIDSDDLADAGLLSSLYAVAARDDADIAFCGFRMREGEAGVEKPRPIPLDPGKKRPADALAELYILRTIHPSICTTLFKADFLREARLSFVEGCRLGQDVEFVTKALSISRRTVFLPDCLYTYRIHVNGITRASRATPEKQAETAVFSVEGQLRAAQYISENSESQKLRNIAQYYMMPKFRLKMLNILAWQNDEKKFMEMLRAPGTKNTLLSSRRVFFKEPGLFFKALFATLFPGPYFEVRKRAEKDSASTHNSSGRR